MLQHLLTFILLLPSLGFAQVRTIVLEINTLINNTNDFRATTEVITREPLEPLWDDKDDWLITIARNTGKLSFRKSLTLMTDTSMIWVTLDNSGGSLCIQNAYRMKSDTLRFDTFEVFCDPFPDTVVTQTFRRDLTRDHIETDFTAETKIEPVPLTCSIEQSSMGNCSHCSIKTRYRLWYRIDGKEYFLGVPPAYYGNLSITTFSGDGKTSLFKRLFTSSKRYEMYGSTVVKGYHSQATLVLN